MKNVKAYGTFTKQNDQIFRTSAFIQWGDSEEIIGACIMCNPGEARIKDREMSEINDGEDISGEIKIDPTMTQIVKIVSESNEGIDLKGRVLIYNLFTLRNTDMKESTRLVDSIDAEDFLLFSNFYHFKRDYRSIPWILIAWGCESGVTIRREKSKWIEFINDRNILCFGKKGRNQLDYYHPLPPNQHIQKEYRSEIIQQYRDYLFKPYRFDIRHPKGVGIINFYRCGKFEVSVPDDAEVEERVVELLKKYNHRINKDKIYNFRRYQGENGIYITKENVNFIENAHSIIMGTKFKDIIIIAYTTGTKKLYFLKDTFNELTEELLLARKNEDFTSNGDDDSRKTKVVLNGIPHSYVPYFNIDLSKDLVISNGHIMVANSIEEYGGSVAFYGGDKSLPISWIHSSVGPVYIDIYEKQGKRIFVVESRSNITVNEMFL